MTDFKGSRTEKNLEAAFAGESMARNRYDFYAKAAEKEGLVQIARLFAETAAQERSHAKQLYRALAGAIGKTAENLAAAVDGELHEHGTLYPAWAEAAAAEGFGEIAALFRSLAVAERFHERRFRALLNRLEKGETHRRETATTWVCEKCGYTFDGKEPPPKCPACGHPRGHFEALGMVAVIPGDGGEPRFVRIGRVSDLETGPFVAATLLGKRVAAFRAEDGSIRAREMTCKHQGADLTAGLVLEGHVTCPRHGWRYNLATGACVNRPLSPPLREHAVRIEGDAILVSLSPAISSISPIPREP